jgi:hypothetical protein
VLSLTAHSLAGHYAVVYSSNGSFNYGKLGAKLTPAPWTSNLNTTLVKFDILSTSSYTLTASGTITATANWVPDAGDFINDPAPANVLVAETSVVSINGGADGDPTANSYSNGIDPAQNVPATSLISVNQSNSPPRYSIQHGQSFTLTVSPSINFTKFGAGPVSSTTMIAQVNYTLSVPNSQVSITSDLDPTYHYDTINKSRALNTMAPSSSGIVMSGDSVLAMDPNVPFDPLGLAPTANHYNSLVSTVLTANLIGRWILPQYTWGLNGTTGRGTNRNTAALSVPTPLDNSFIYLTPQLCNGSQPITVTESVEVVDLGVPSNIAPDKTAYYKMMYHVPEEVTLPQDWPGFWHGAYESISDSASNVTTVTTRSGQITTTDEWTFKAGVDAPLIESLGLKSDLEHKGGTVTQCTWQQSYSVPLAVFPYKSEIIAAPRFNVTRVVMLHYDVHGFTNWTYEFYAEPKLLSTTITSAPGVGQLDVDGIQFDSRIVGDEQKQIDSFTLSPDGLWMLGFNL